MTPLLVRVRRRLLREWRNARIRRADRRGAADTPAAFARRTGIDPAAPLAPSPQRAWPGRWPGGPVDSALHALGVRAAAEARAHRFDLLGSGTTAVADRTFAAAERIRQLAGELPDTVLGGYVPIDWHLDFKSGCRWSPSLYYLDVPLSPGPACDVKVPRELSRFQHIGALAASGTESDGLEVLVQMLDWIAANPVRRGVNWACTMDVAIRAVNWVWAVRLAENVFQCHPAASFQVVRSLYEHGRHIEHNLEYYEEGGGNHYLSNVAGLLYIGAACPQFPESDRWVLFALQELVSEMERQVYSDGGSNEASTHYHRLVAEIFCSCAALAERLGPARRERLRAAPIRDHRVDPPLRPHTASGLDLRAGARVLPPAFYDRLARMAELTSWLTKPNGLVPQFGDNDSARLHKLTPIVDDDSRDHRHLLAVAGVLLGRPDLRAAGRPYDCEGDLVAGGVRVESSGRVAARAAGIRYFPDSGIAVMFNGPAWLAVTCGPNGQNGRGGHGHNDKLSFELNVAGRDVVVDGGSFVYTPDPELRNAFRSTAAHSTIAVSGAEQDRWIEGTRGLFSLPERSSAKLHAAVNGVVSGEHMGFGAPHRRRWDLQARALEILDELPVASERTLHLNLAPEVRCVLVDRKDGGYAVVLRHEDGLQVDVWFEGTERPSLVEGFFSKGYGQRVANERLAARMTGARARTVLTWTA